MYPNQNPPRLIKIAVSTGSGLAEGNPLNLNGKLIAVGLVPPANSGLYDFEILRNGTPATGIFAAVKQSGAQTLPAQGQLFALNDVSISNAEVDGTYYATLFFDE